MEIDKSKNFKARVVEMWHHVNVMISITSRYIKKYKDMMTETQKKEIEEQLGILIRQKDDLEKIAAENDIDLNQENKNDRA